MGSNRFVNATLWIYIPIRYSSIVVLLRRRSFKSLAQASMFKFACAKRCKQYFIRWNCNVTTTYEILIKEIRRACTLRIFRPSQHPSSHGIVYGIWFVRKKRRSIRRVQETCETKRNKTNPIRRYSVYACSYSSLKSCEADILVAKVWESRQCIFSRQTNFFLFYLVWIIALV